MSFDILQEEVTRLSKNKSLDKCIDQSELFLDYLDELETSLAGDNGEYDAKELMTQFDTMSKNVLKNEKSINSSIKKYSVAIDAKVFNSNNRVDLESIYKYPIDLKKERIKNLIDRSIIIHLLRTGQFEISSKLEVERRMDIPQELLDNFETLNMISDNLLLHDNLKPAIEWAGENSENLRLIGSDLEFNLHRLQFFKLFEDSSQKKSDVNTDKGNLYRAFQYAKDNFPYFGTTHLETISKLLFSTAIWKDTDEITREIQDEINEKTIQSIHSQLCQDYCSLMGLISQSPIFNTLLASFVALPICLKFENIYKISNGKLDWTSNNELPFEINLPNYLQFHSIFVCPISKEETTPENPAMVLPCKHLISKQSVIKLSHANISSFKCPYCPKTTMSGQCKEVKFVNI